MPQNTVITNFVSAFPGMNADSSDSGDNYLSRFSGETTLQIPFGRAVMTGTSDKLAVSLTSAANVRKLLGIVAFNAFNQIASQLGNVADSNGNIGLVATAPLRVKYRGRLWVPITENVDPTLGVRVSIDATGGGIGTFRATASAGHTIDLSKFCSWFGTYATTANGSAAVLDFDFRMKGLATAD
jgi:hypothetical protein